MKYQDIQSKKRDDLLAMLGERKEELRALSFSFASSQPGERSPAVVKREIAQILTAINSQDTKNA